ncbi:MAG: metalloregulator ArsR/SmtB family transcription factor [Stappiaceae bacterium]
MPPPAITDMFSALGDPVRFAIVERLLKEGEVTAGDIAKPFEISKPAISRHIAVLEKAGLIERKVEKQFRICRIQPQALRSLDEWLEQYRRFWDTSFARLEKLFDQQAQETSSPEDKDSHDDGN